MSVEARRQAWNARASARIEASGDRLPAAVLAHALRQRWMPRTLRAAVDAYWRAHPIRAERLARALAARSGTPDGWTWRAGDASFRLPPLPYRLPKAECVPGRCVVCGQPVYALGWHCVRTGAEAPGRAAWHSACVVAWKFWTAPADHRKILSKLQGRRCALSGSRLLRTAEVDHRVPLFLVWREHRDRPWPELLSFWGRPNLQVVNREAHGEKCVDETRGRAEFRRQLDAQSA
jgi:hypothetical protein